MPLKEDGSLRRLRALGSVAGSSGELKIVVNQNPVVTHRRPRVPHFLVPLKARGRKSDVIGLPLQRWKSHRNIRGYELVEAAAPLGI